MRYLWPIGIGFGFATVIHGCSEVVPGSCYPDPAGGAGGAGSMAVGVGVGAGSGDFISPPPNGPLDYGGGSNPCIMPQSPCNEKCQTDYENVAAECGKKPNDAQFRACQDSAYASYKSCRDNCVVIEESRWRKQCAEKAEACEAECRKLPEDDKDARRICWEGCNNARAECIRKCKK